MTAMNYKQLREFYLEEKRRELRGTKLFCYLFMPTLFFLGIIFLRLSYSLSSYIFSLVIILLSIIGIIPSIKDIKKIKQDIEDNK